MRIGGFSCRELHSHHLRHPAALILSESAKIQVLSDIGRRKTLITRHRWDSSLISNISIHYWTKGEGPFVSPNPTRPSSHFSAHCCKYSSHGRLPLHLFARHGARRTVCTSHCVEVYWRGGCLCWKLLHSLLLAVLCCVCVCVFPFLLFRCSTLVLHPLPSDGKGN